MSNLYFLDPNPNGTQGVLLLHGLGANSSSWIFQIKALQAAGFRPLVPDIIGFGQSKYDGRGWSFRRVAGELAGLVGELKCGRVDVVGLSMGGVIAQEMALNHPSILRKLVLASTFSVLRPASISQWVYFFSRALVVHTMGMKAQASIVAERVFPNPGQESLRELAQAQIASADPRAYRSAMRSLGLFNSSKRLSKIGTPTLVITGAEDTTVSPVRQKMLADGIPGARQIIVEHAGHAISIDQYERFNELLLKFLRE